MLMVLYYILLVIFNYLPLEFKSFGLLKKPEVLFSTLPYSRLI